MKFKLSKEKAIKFRKKIQDIDDYCKENNITKSFSGDSYYFQLNDIKYRVSNHTVSKSNRNAFSKDGERLRKEYHPDGENGMVCITASKTRIIEIHKALKSGKKLDRRGNVV